MIIDELNYFTKMCFIRQKQKEWLQQKISSQTKRIAFSLCVLLLFSIQHNASKIVDDLIFKRFQINSMVQKQQRNNQIE